MPLLLLAAGTLLVGGLGAYAIHSTSQGLNQATTDTGKGLSTGAALIGAGVGVAVVVYAINKTRK